MQKFVSVILLVCVAFAQTQNEIDFGAEDREEQDRLQAVIEELCKNRPENEYFRLSTESNCRDAVRCVQNDFKGGHSLAAVRCPTGLVFDLDGQTCNWAAQVSVLYVILTYFKIFQAFILFNESFDLMNIYIQQC